jgi:hypothetical protein
MGPLFGQALGRNAERGPGATLIGRLTEIPMLDGS